jgi:hypothetical protein
MKNTQTARNERGGGEMIKCQYAALGTYGHECGSPATHVLITVMDSETKAALRCMGATVPADGLSRAGRCEAHWNVREFGDGAFVRNELLGVTV